MTCHESSLTEMEIENNDNLLSDTAEEGRKGKDNAVLLEAKRIQVGW